jgi:hypothetical protein
MGYSRAGSRILCFCLLTLSLKAQPPRFQHFEYIDRYAEEAKRQMLMYRIPASVTLAQAIFESSSGQSELAQRSNNHFGIKCHAAWDGDTVVKHDDRMNECFRKYGTVAESYTDHSEFIASRKWYRELFTLSITDYRGWCNGLKAAGYATYPSYAQELIRIIEENRLYELDRVEPMAMKLLPPVKREIISRPRDPSEFDMKDMAKAKILFVDERYIYPRSLDLEIEDDVEQLIVREP